MSTNGWWYSTICKKDYVMKGKIKGFSQEKDVRQEPARPGAFPPHSTGTHRKHTGRWKQYSDRSFLGIFSDNFRPFPTGKHRELAGIHRKKVPAGILLPLPVLSCGIRWLFRTFPAGSRRIRWPESSSWAVYYPWIHKYIMADDRIQPLSTKKF